MSHIPPTQNGPQAAPAPSALRLWAFRLIAVVGVPLLFLLLLEGGLRLVGYGHPTHFLIPDDKPGYLRTNPAFLSLFMSDSFDLQPLNFRVAARKPANTVRIVVLGESAAQGVPAPEFGFAAQLRAQLRARYPGKNIEVLNTGIAAINSHIIVQIAHDMAAVSPDLYVVYMGNNEVVGPYGPGCPYLPAMPPRWVIRLSVLVHSTRTGQLFRNALAKLAAHKGSGEPVRRMDVFVEQATSADDPQLAAVCRSFEANLTDIVHTARRAGARTLLCTVVANLKDWPPVLSEHRKGLASDELAAFDASLRRGRLEWRLGETAAARADLEAARRIDPQYAECTYLLGTLDLQAGNTAAARTDFLDAERCDAIRLRADPRLNAIVREVARRNASVGLLDTALLLGSDPASTAPPAGHELLLEHVHLNWDGNYAVARALAERVAADLLHGVPAAHPWLDSDGCAAALGYTPPAQLAMLQGFLRLIEGPPFTNQLTHLEDLARVTRAIAEFKEACTPGVLREARQTVQAALAADPENPDLWKQDEVLESDLGDGAAALLAEQHRQAYQPLSDALATDEALQLMRLRRFDDARSLLEKTAADCSPHDLPKMGPAFAEFFLLTRKPAEGVRRFDALIARQPGDAGLRLLRASLAKSAGDLAAAEREYREVLAENPANPNALEALITLLNDSNRADEARQLSLSAADTQPANHSNNLRAAFIQKARGDSAEVVRLLLAAEQSGPVSSAIEMHLARGLFDGHRRDDALDHLAIARQLAQIEENPEAVAALDRILQHVRNEGP